MRRRDEIAITAEKAFIETHRRQLHIERHANVSDVNLFSVFRATQTKSKLDRVCYMIESAKSRSTDYKSR